MAFYDHQPLIQPLYRVVTDIMAGNIAVPRFQRPGTESTWTPDQRRELLDSLLRGFPIGTILLWPSKIKMATFDTVGGFRISPLEEGGLRRYLLDGHQRLSSVVKILGQGLLPDLIERGVAAAEKVDEYWYFDVSPNAKSVASPDRFLCFRFESEAQALAEEQGWQAQKDALVLLPLRLILNRAELNRWLRQHPDLSDEQIREAENLRDSLREYSLPIMQLQAGNLEDAAESFKRINSSGTPMSPFFMVTALAYREDFDPQQMFEEMRAQYLEPVGWADVADSDLLRICVGINGDDPTTLEVEKLAKKLAKNRDLIDRAFQAAAKVASIFCTLGVQGPQALPYSWQLITAAIVVARHDSVLAGPEQAAIARWFWLSSYGEFFSSGNRRSTFAYAQNVLLVLMQGGDPQAFGELRVEKKVKRLVRFDFRAARSSLCLLAMARCQDAGDVMGAAHRALLKGPGVLALLRSNGRRSDWWNLAITTDGMDLNQIRAELRNCAQNTEQPSQTLQNLGFSSKAMDSIENLLLARRDVIEASEREFVLAMGLDWDNG
jgi:hypothetical protein